MAKKVATLKQLGKSEKARSNSGFLKKENGKAADIPSLFFVLTTIACDHRSPVRIFLLPKQGVKDGIRSKRSFNSNGQWTIGRR